MHVGLPVDPLNGISELVGNLPHNGPCFKGHIASAIPNKGFDQHPCFTSNHSLCETHNLGSSLASRSPSCRLEAPGPQAARPRFWLKTAVTSHEGPKYHERWLSQTRLLQPAQQNRKWPASPTNLTLPRLKQGHASSGSCAMLAST